MSEPVTEPMAGLRVVARGWGWRHPGRKAWAVRGLDLVIEPGERVLLLGAGGAGKSTLLAGLAGLLDPSGSGTGSGQCEGELLLDGTPARAARLAAVSAGRARTGLLLQDPQAQTVLHRCGDDVAFGLENHAVPPAEIWPRVSAALGSVGFPYGATHSTHELSGGERQRLALAGVLALRPDLLLLDEPTAMLDPAGAALVREAVAALPASSGLLVVEHRVEPWLPLVDRVVVLAAAGGVLADGPPSSVFIHAATELDRAGVWTPGLAGALASSLRRRARPTGAAGEPLLTARELSVGRREPVLKDVGFTLRRGVALPVTGPNGSGKSTLATAVAGLTPPLAGSLSAAPALARGLSPAPVRWRARDLVRRIGTVFQDPQHQFVTSTVRSELALGAAPSRAEELLDRLGLAHLAAANPFTLSGGEQRRLSVGTALAAAPDVLVLDEPTFGQDARTWVALVALLQELLDGGCAALVATHDAELAGVLGPGIEL